MQVPRPAPPGAEQQRLREITEQVVLAEEMGFEHVWFVEHHFLTEWAHSSAPEVMLAVLSQHTTKMRLGFGVVLLPVHHPLHVAAKTATLDIMSDGRVDVGVGRAGNPYQLESFGVKLEDTRGIWAKTTIHTMLSHEAYTGTVVWGANAKDGAPPVRVEDAHPAIVSKRDFQKARRLLGSRAPKKVNPRRASSPYLLSGIAKCETCGKAMTAAEAKSGKYTYYICHSLLKRGKGTCETPRLNAKKFEKIIVDEIRANILTESNIRDLVKLLDEEMDGVARDQRHMLESIDGELEEVKKQLGRVWHFIARSDSVDVAEASDLIVELRERKEKLEIATEEARALLSPNPPKG